MGSGASSYARALYDSGTNSCRGTVRMACKTRSLRTPRARNCSSTMRTLACSGDHDGASAHEPVVPGNIHASARTVTARTRPPVLTDVVSGACLDGTSTIPDAGGVGVNGQRIEGGSDGSLWISYADAMTGPPS